jgi:hypothetical protein
MDPSGPAGTPGPDGLPPTRLRPPWPSLVLALLPVAAASVLPLPGCGGSDLGPSVVVQDSAGVTLTHSRAPEWDEGEEWRLASEPRLEIGAGEGPREELLSRIQNAFPLSDGRIVVGNTSSPPEVRVYGSDGEYLQTLGGAGQGPGEFLMVTRIHRMAGDTVAVFDFPSSRVTRFPPDGGPPETSFWDAIGETEFRQWVPWGMFQDGTFLVRPNQIFPPDARDRGRHQAELARIDQHGTLLARMGPFPAAEYDARNPDPGSRGLIHFGIRDAFHAHGDRLYVGAGDRFRINVHDLEGRLVRGFSREYERPRVTARDLDEELARALEQQADPAARDRIRRRWEGLAAAERFPAHGTRMVVDTGGNVWVEHHFHEGLDARTWSVFDPEGRWLGEVGVPSRLRITWIGNDEVMGAWTDELDVPSVRVYRLEGR